MLTGLGFAMPVLMCTVTLLGLAIGSFLNVVICRVPAGQSVVSPASRCPNCESPVRTRHNVPVLGWLVLRGRCADCASTISVRYPLVEAATATLFAAVTWQAARLHLLAVLPALLVFTAAGVALAAIDIDVMRLPNRIVYPTFLAVVVLIAAASAVTGHVEPLVRAVVAAAALTAVFFAIVMVQPGGMGLGDVKLAAVIGAVLGVVSYPAVLVGTFAAFVIGSLVGAALIVTRRAGRRSAIPFGPSLIAGALLALFAAAPVTDFYSALTHSA